MADERALQSMPSGRTPLPDLKATQALAEALSPCLETGDVVALYGSLGAGKTEFARFLLRARGITGDIPSPTFTLLQTYDTDRGPIHHLDLYRLKSDDELDELGWEDLMASGAILVEWPERAGSRLPARRLDLVFELSSHGRFCTPTPHGSWDARLKAHLEKAER